MLIMLQKLRGNRKMLLTFFYFLVGKDEDAEARIRLAMLDDEDGDLGQDVGPMEPNFDGKFGGSPGKKASLNLSLELSKMNFRAKNQESTFAIHGVAPNTSAAMMNIEQERTDKIMELFNQLPLDEDEFAFLNASARGPMPDPFAQDESLMSARQVAYAADGQDFNATILTNFDNELDEMDAQYDRHKSRQLLENFWALILLEDQRVLLHCQANERFLSLPFETRGFR